MTDKGMFEFDDLQGVLSRVADRLDDSVVITMGCGDACPIYPGKRYEDWSLNDPSELDLDGVKEVRNDISERISNLLKEMKVL